METIKVNVKDVLQTVTGEQIQALDPEAASALEKLHKATGLGSDFLGLEVTRKSASRLELIKLTQNP